MNGFVHGLCVHKQTPTNELLNPRLPIASSAIDYGLHQPSSFPNGHYPSGMPYTHPPTLPPPHHRATSGTAHTLDPANRNVADHVRQRVDHMPALRGLEPGAVPSPGGYQEYHAHLSPTHEDRFSEPLVWSNPAGRIGASFAYPIPSISRSSYSDERTCEYSLFVELKPIDLFTHLQRSQMILHLQLALHRIPPYQTQPCPTVQNSLLLPIINVLRNLLQFSACATPISRRFTLLVIYFAGGPIMPVLLAFRRCAASQAIHNTPTCHPQLTYQIPRSTHQYRTQAYHIHTWHLRGR